jgi:hypothetical protein
MLIGYARVSTHEQNLDLQRGALKAAGREKIFVNEVSGSVAARPGLQQALDMLREKDVLVVWRLDRLAGPSGTSSNWWCSGGTKGGFSQPAGGGGYFLLRRQANLPRLWCSSRVRAQPDPRADHRWSQRRQG